MHACNTCLTCMHCASCCAHSSTGNGYTVDDSVEIILSECTQPVEEGLHAHMHAGTTHTSTSTTRTAVAYTPVTHKQMGDYIESRDEHDLSDVRTQAASGSKGEVFSPVCNAQTRKCDGQRNVYIAEKQVKMHTSCYWDLFNGMTRCVNEYVIHVKLTTGQHMHASHAVAAHRAHMHVLIHSCSSLSLFLCAEPHAFALLATRPLIPTHACECR